MSEKLNGGTLHRKARPHDCSAPAIQSNGILPGDEWVCGECGSKWACIASCDQREPEPYWDRKSIGYTRGRTT